MIRCTLIWMNKLKSKSRIDSTLLSFPSKWRSWFFFLSFAFLNISFPKSETRTGSSVRSWELHSVIIAFEEFTVFCTGKSFSEAHNICRTCCVPNCSECQNKTKTTICVHYMFCRYSQLTIFMSNEQSVVILWVCWCKNKSLWQRFTCTRAIITCRF